MLIIERLLGEGLYIGNDVYIQIRRVQGRRRVKLAIRVPDGVPVRRAELEKTQEVFPESESASASSVGGSTRALSILVIEDDPDHAQLISMALRSLGDHRVRTADSLSAVGAAVSAFEADGARPDVVLLDYYLGKDHGDRLIDELRSDRRLAGVPIVMPSSGSDPRVVAECLSAGASAFLQKSGDFLGFQESLGRMVSFWGHQRQLAAGVRV